MSEENEMTTEIPEHLRHIEFKPWHFYTTKDRNGKLMHTLTSNFVEETLRKMKLYHAAGWFKRKGLRKANVL